MADRSNAKLNTYIEEQIGLWNGTVHGIALRNMYERNADYEDICDVMNVDYYDFEEVI